ncbi:MAG: sigma-70 family RNA polymerase sigma factor [Verrucomicrobia bacterium]|nr:MAG: sigma-70 family RNA polymerase sigma factor [Verrucomicrobiota bacterium]
MSEGVLNSGWVQSLYETKAAEILLYGRALGLSHSESEDVLQETFISVLQLEAQPTHPFRFVVRCFRNRALNYRRSFWRRFVRELEAHRWFERSSEPSADENRAMSFLAALSQEQREVIVLKIWHDETFEAIGNLLDISPNTAAGRYRYGLRKLRDLLKGSQYERDTELGRDDARLGAAQAITPNFRAAL